MVIESAPAGFPVDRAKPRDFLGHPKGLSFLFGTEMWERFAHYGLLSILILYMVNYLFLPGHVESVIGYGPIKTSFETVFGPLSVQAFASQVYGAYGFLAYFAPFFGGIIADRFLGQRRTVIAGATLMSIGYFMMSVEALFFVSFIFIVLGNGLFKPNISTQVGNLYAPGDHRHDRAFSIFYVGINLGGLFGPFICGYLGEDVSWRYGFISVGAGLVLGLMIYLYGLRFIPQDALARAKATKQENKPLTAPEIKAVLALIALTVLSALFWSAWYLQFNILNLWADEFTDREIDLFGWHRTIPTTWFQMINPIFILALTPVVTRIWAKQAERDREPSTVVKMAIGCFLMAFSFIFMLAPVATLGTGKASAYWLVAFFLIYTAGELYVSPIGLALVTKVAPPRVVSMMMGVWFISYSIGFYLSGLLGSFWEAMSKSAFFLMTAAIPAVAGAAIWAFSGPLKPMLDEKKSRL